MKKDRGCKKGGKGNEKNGGKIKGRNGESGGEICFISFGGHPL